MDHEDTRVPSRASPHPEQPQVRPVRTGSSIHPVRPVHSVQSIQHPGPGVHTAPSRTPAGPLRQTPVKHQVSQTANAEAIQKRAEGRAKVPPKFRDSFKRFFFSPTGGLKILRLGLLIGALACFITATAHQSYIVITVLEICIVLFFILSYMLTLHHLLTYLDWPLLDLINSFITAVFLLIVAILAMQEKERRHLFYVGGSLCLAAAILCLVDAILVTKKMRNEVKKALGIKIETTPVPAGAPSKTSTHLPSKSPTRASSKASMQTQASVSHPSPR